MDVGGKVLGYVIDRRLGQGGMGAVFHAVHPALGQEVAVKVLDPILARNAEVRERFIQEARIQALLQHLNIVRVLTAEVEGGEPSLVMEYVEGLSLDKVLERRGALPLEDALKVMGQVLSAVGYAHSRGVVHRDLKPGNILVQADGTVKVTDFGIAKILGGARLTRTGTAMGSAHYMSPEQVLGRKDIDHRADIYALGCTFYEVLTGRPPFGHLDSPDTDSDFAVKTAHVQAPPPDPRTLRPNLPEMVARVILLCLEKDPGKRPQSCEEVWEGLREGARAGARAAGREQGSRLLGVIGDAVARTSEQGSRPLEEVREMDVHEQGPLLVVQEGPQKEVRRSRRGLWLIAGAVALVGVGTGVGLALKGGKAGIEWVTIPGGTFMMGSNDGDDLEKPVHRVTVQTFQIARTEVTFGQYRKCVEAGACTPPHTDDGTCVIADPDREKVSKGVLPSRFRGDDQPVVCVDWHQAVAFSSWVGGRLPTEAEWEYAARSGGKDRKYPWGDAKPTCERAVMLDESRGTGCGTKATWPVCSKPKGNTEQGLCDMAGNVWEWVQDWFHPSYEGAPSDGSAWETPAGVLRVLRGGSWGSDDMLLRAASRSGFLPDTPVDVIGFRPARSLQ